jgi:membrane protease YdiL (CAAX protease family)
VSVVWPDRVLRDSLKGRPLIARIIAHRALTSTDALLPVVLLLGVVLLLVTVARHPHQDEPRSGPEGSSRPLLRVGLGLSLLLGAVIGTSLLPIAGSTGALARGLGLALAEVLIAIALTLRLGVGRALALRMPARAGLVLTMAPLIGVALWVAGLFAVRFIPATSESPIEAVVSWPSGSLAVALVSVMVPVAEELFFRGFVFGSVEKRYGNAAAFGVTVLLFAVAHLPQTFGAWGAFTAILVTGAGLTALRYSTRSILPGTLAHLAHNAIVVFLNAF